MMPVMSGMEVLRQVKSDPDISQVPIIVITSDQSAEVESLDLKASDFIPKPYPQAGVILARILRTIELSEDREIIQSTERDPLTGLYNREYFYRYAEQFDQHHKDLDMDAIVVDVNHFHMINERFGTAYGDEVLRRIGEKVREMVRDTGGIVCRREADTFMVYCPHGKDYRAILESASIGLGGDDSANNRVRLRMGVYANVDKTIDLERRFDRAKMAADTVQGNFTQPIGFYDSGLHERELYAEQLIEDFHQAIDEKQFKVFYQPKFDVRSEIPVLASAEALIRWKHPELGMISPGVFIPLFEDNGLIQELDHYVWRETAARIRDWKDRFGFVGAGLGERLAHRHVRPAPHRHLAGDAGGAGAHDARVPAGDHRIGLHAGFRADHRDGEPPARAGLPDRDGRLRHRLLVAEHDLDPAHRRAQARHAVHPQRLQRAQGHAHARGHHRHRRLPVGAGHRRGRGDRGADARAQGHGLRLRAGLLLLAPRAGRRIRAVHGGAQGAAAHGTRSTLRPPPDTSPTARKAPSARSPTRSRADSRAGLLRGHRERLLRGVQLGRAATRTCRSSAAARFLRRDAAQHPAGGLPRRPGTRGALLQKDACSPS